MASLQKETDFLSKHDIEVHDLAHNVEKYLLDMETGQRGYVITGDPSYLEPYNNGSTQWEVDYNKLYNLISDNPDQQKNLNNIKMNIMKWIDIAGKPSIDMKKNKREDEVLNFFKNDLGKPEMDAMRNKFTSFLNTEKTLTNERIANLASSNERLIITIYILWAIVALVSIAVAIVISRNIVTTIKDVTGTIKDIAAGGNLNRRIQIRTRDEIADLGRGMNELLEVMEQQSEMKDQIAEVSTLVQNESNLKSLSEVFVNKSAFLLNVPYSVLYTVKDNELVKMASYAGDKDNNAGKSVIAWGEGLVGQSAADQKIIALEQVPAQYVQISSGLGSTPPSYILVAPIIFEGLTLAVLEIAALQKLSDHHMEMLKQMLDNTGVTMHSVINRMEIQRLYMESQSMNEELQAQSEELQVQTEELQVQSEELHMQTDELMTLNDKLEVQKNSAESAAAEMEKYAEQVKTSSNYKSEFLANMSHELRTPLNSMLILSQILSENKSGNLLEEEVKYASVIHSSGTDLLHLINDILDLSKVEAGKVQLEIAPVNMTELPDVLYRLFEKTAESKSLHFTIDIAPNVSDIIYSDELRLHQILRNLLSNAFKFTERGHVNLSVYIQDSVITSIEPTSNQTLVFAVQDTGVGIPEHQQELIFEAFKQADGATARKFGGTGLGLSISLQFAQLLGGDLVVESQEGEGSTFRLQIPYQVEHIDESPLMMTLPEVSKVASLDTEPLTRSAWSSDPTVYQQEEGQYIMEESKLFDGKKVLVVDDDIRNVYALANALEKYNMKVLTAQNGYECLDMLQAEQDIDIVLMDIMMPEMDGYQTMRNIRTTLELNDLPILALTAKAMKEDKDKCLAAGASDYLSKPLNISEVISRMKIWLTKVEVS